MQMWAGGAVPEVAFTDTAYTGGSTTVRSAMAGARISHGFMMRMRYVNRVSAIVSMWKVIDVRE